MAKTVDRESLAWAAGFFDGEGHVGFQTRRTRAGTTHRLAQVQVCQSHREPLDRLVVALGVGRVNGPYRTKNPKAQPYWAYRVSTHEGVQHLAASLWPWLGAVKREQFRAVLTRWKEFVTEVVVCEHGVQKLTCTTCRSAWVTAAWAKRRAVPA